MRMIFYFLLSVLLAFGRVNSSKPRDDRFQIYHTKALSSAPVKLDDSTFKKITATPRDYTVLVLLTALDSKFGCQLCREFQPEFEILSRSWTKGDKEGNSQLIFASLDFSDGRETFMSLGLQTAPVLLLYQPTTGAHAVVSSDPLQYDFTSGPQIAQQVHSWLSRYMTNRPRPPVRRPVNWMRWFSTTVIALGIGTALITSSRYILPILQNRNVWAAASLIAILLFTSGHMFNQIRKVPYVVGDGKGGVTYFAGGFQNQYGMESQVVAALYGILAFCAISLTVKVPRIADAKKQQVAVFIWGGALFLMYGVLLRVFRFKNDIGFGVFLGLQGTIESGAVAWNAPRRPCGF